MLSSERQNGGQVTTQSKSDFLYQELGDNLFQPLSNGGGEEATIEESEWVLIGSILHQPLISSDPDSKLPPNWFDTCRSFSGGNTCSAPLSLDPFPQSPRNPGPEAASKPVGCPLF